MSNNMSGTVERELSIAEGGGANNTSLGLLCVRRSFFCRGAILGNVGPPWGAEVAVAYVQCFLSVLQLRKRRHPPSRVG